MLTVACGEMDAGAVLSDGMLAPAQENELMNLAGLDACVAEVEE